MKKPLKKLVTAKKPKRKIFKSAVSAPKLDKSGTSQTVVCNHCNKDFVAKVTSVQNGKSKFCSLSCRASFVNKRKMSKKYVCKQCSKTYASRNVNTKYCSKKCSNKCSDIKRKLDPEQKKQVEVLKARGCEICQWDKASRDIHHVVAVSKGGANDASNLLTLCPNHHRMADQELIDISALYELIKFRIKKIGF